MSRRSITVVFSVIIGILAVPFIAMQFTDEVNWDGADFVAAGLLLFCLSFLCLFIFERVSNKMLRVSLLVFAVLAFILIYMELAVDIFG